MCTPGFGVLDEHVRAWLALSASQICVGPVETTNGRSLRSTSIKCVEHTQTPSMRLMLGACFRMFSRSVFMTGQILGILFVVYSHLHHVDAVHLTYQHPVPDARFAPFTIISGTCIYFVPNREMHQVPCAVLQNQVRAVTQHICSTGTRAHVVLKQFRELKLRRVSL